MAGGPSMSSRVAAVAALLLLTGSGVGTATERKPFVETDEVAPGSPLPPCSQTGQVLRELRLQAGQSARRALKESLGAGRMLGVEENVTVEGGDDAGPFLRVRYPEDSLNFGAAGDDRPLGGASFYVPLAGRGVSCLHYRVRFPGEFDFVKGGKLPGLFAGEAPTGGEKVTGRDGWTIRLMWREQGAGELYEYVFNKKGRYGASVGRGSFHFPRGRWVDVDLEVRENDPGKRNGIARLWIDGRLVVEQRDIVFATAHPDDAERGLLFSTFFGGSDASWATPSDQHVDFADFRLYERAGE